MHELAYRSDGSAGFNKTLQPQSSTQLELGAKWRDDACGLALHAALFRADSDDEIGALTNAGGRSSFHNVGRTQRGGVELALQWQPRPAWRTQLAPHHAGVALAGAVLSSTEVGRTRRRTRAAARHGRRPTSLPPFRRS